MSKKFLIKSFFLFCLLSSTAALSATPHSALAAGTIQCVFGNGSSNATCDLTSPLPQNCTTISGSPGETKMQCDGYPKDYTCPENSTNTVTCTPPPQCQVDNSSPGLKQWVCPTTKQGNLPNNCSPLLGNSSQMRCYEPQGYTCDINGSTLDCRPNITVSGGGSATGGSSAGTNINLNLISPGNLSYTPLEPLPGETLNDKGQFSGDLGNLLNIFFKIALSLGAFTAVAMLVIGGISYMVSDVVNTKHEALLRIQNAFWGLLLIIGAVLILNTINPQLVNFTNVLTPAQYKAATTPAAGCDSYCQFNKKYNAVLNSTPQNGGLTPQSCYQARQNQISLQQQHDTYTNCQKVNFITQACSAVKGVNITQLDQQNLLNGEMVSRCDQLGVPSKP